MTLQYWSVRELRVQNWKQPSPEKLWKSGTGDIAHNRNNTGKATSTEQNKMFKKMGRRARVDETPSSSETEQTAAKKGKSKKWGKQKPQNWPLNSMKKRPSSTIDNLSNTTENETVPQETVGPGQR